MRNLLKLGFKLFLIAAVAGLALGVTNAVTAGPIAEQQIAEANAARLKVLPEAVDFEEIDAADGLDEVYKGYDEAGTLLGATGKITVNGFGGPVEVTVGLGLDGVITGVNVGGSNFKETAGLGAKAKEPWFGEQYIGLSSPVALKKNGGQVDAITSATITSDAVTQGVETVVSSINTFLKGVQ